MNKYMGRWGILAYAGITVGFLGWVLGFAGVAVYAGDFELLGLIAAPGAVMSLGLAAVTIIVLDCLMARFGPRHWSLQVGLWGLLLLFMGLLCLLVSHWIAPIIEARPALLRALGTVGASYRVPDPVSILLMAVGAVLLLIVTAGLFRDPGSEPN